MLDDSVEKAMKQARFNLEVEEYHTNLVRKDLKKESSEEEVMRMATEKGQE